MTHTWLSTATFPRGLPGLEFPEQVMLVGDFWVEERYFCNLIIPYKIPASNLATPLRSLQGRCPRCVKTTYQLSIAVWDGSEVACLSKLASFSFAFRSAECQQHRLVQPPYYYPRSYPVEFLDPNVFPHLPAKLHQWMFNNLLCDYDKWVDYCNQKGISYA